MSSKSLSITIGISAYNEEESIGVFLQSLLTQRRSSYVIDNIIVISDKSSDNTSRVVKSTPDPRIKLINGLVRKGKPYRLNQLFKMNTSDILVVFDADVLLENEWVLEKLVESFTQDTELAFAYGNLQPLPPETLIENAINNYSYARNTFIEEYNYGEKAYGARGAAMAFSKKFTKSITLPDNALCDDGFYYFTCKSLHLKMKYVNEAVVLYRSPQTTSDYVKQAIRYYIGGRQINNYFDKNIVEEGYSVPSLINIKYMLYQIMKNPVGYLYLKFLMKVALYKASKKIQHVSALWDTIDTSKRLTPTKSQAQWGWRRRSRYAV